MVGLGAMGLPMAVNLHRAGLRLQVHTRSRRAETTRSLPAQRAASTQLLPRKCRYFAAASVMTPRLTTCCSVRTVPPSSSNPAASWSTAPPPPPWAQQTAASKRSSALLDAPVTGGTEGARAGTLTVLVGGDEAVLAKVRPLLEVIGGSIHHIGPVGRGQQAKAVNQVLVAGSYAAVAEAIMLGQRLELPMQQVIDALRSGAAGSWALNHRSGAMLEESYPLGFKLRLHRKDLIIALEAANDIELDMPITTLVEKLEAKLIERGYGDEDVSALHRWNAVMKEA